MSIEKMMLVNIVGSVKSLDKTLLTIVKSEMFHPELVDGGNLDSNFSHMNEQNPYVDLMHKLDEIVNVLEITPLFTDYSKLHMDFDDIEDKVNELYDEIKETSRKQSGLINSVSLHEQSLSQIKHMAGLKVNLDDVFSSRYANAKFGRLPVDSYLKLDYFKDKDFFFFPFDNNNDYYWGVYFMPKKNQAEIDEIFKSLYFEEYVIPDYIKGTPDLAAENINEQIRQEKISIESLEIQLTKLKKENETFLLQAFSKIKMLHDTFNFRKYAVVFKKEFRLEGFVLQNDINKFAKLFDSIDTVIVDQLPPDADTRVTPPVKLKTCKLFRPFEMFVETYGLPDYDGINPSSYIGFIYSLLFGIMFGDFGQGMAVIIFGALLWKLKKMMLGKILTRCGVFSMIFGLMYGSFFGFESEFKPFWNALGLGNIFPLDVLNSSTSLILLILTLGLGITIILASICINIYLGFKNKNITKAVFSQNGIAGFLMYGGVITASLFLLELNINLFNPIFLICVVFIPLVLIFFSQPLGDFITKKLNLHKKQNNEDEKFSVIDASFEMFDILMSYCTNTLSFLRVGGFILSHAALMLVVMKFAHMAGSFASPLVVVIGNALVMGLEGLIVGIQVLRLIYYETFSRFYSGDGKPFNPAKVSFKPNK